MMSPDSGSSNFSGMVGFKQFPQAGERAHVVRFDAAFTDFHRRRRVHDGQTFHFAQQKRLALPRAQGGNGIGNTSGKLAVGDFLLRAEGGVGNLFPAGRLILFFVAGEEKIENLLHLAPTVHVGDAVAQNAVEQRRPFLRRSQLVVAHQFEQAVLHHIGSQGGVAQFDQRHTRGAHAHLGAKAVERDRIVLRGVDHERWGEGISMIHSIVGQFWRVGFGRKRGLSLCNAVPGAVMTADSLARLKISVTPPGLRLRRAP